MINKYLEKIAGTLSSTIKAVGGVAKDAVTEVATDVSKAFGSGFANKAYDLGVKNQRKLRNIKDAESFMRGMRGKGVPLKDLQGFRKDLQKDKNKAIVKSTLYATGSVYGGNKLLNKIKQNNEAQYYQ